jgi:hypothetical protein
MASTTQSSNQVLEAMVWYFGRKECRSIQFVDDVAGSLDGESFDLNAIDEDYNEKKYLFWLDNGSASDPTPAADQTLVAVSYTDNDDAATIAGLFKVAADALEFKCSNSAGLSICENDFIGLITAEVNTNAPSETFTVLQASSGGSLGAIAVGGSEVSPTQSLEDIFRDDEGETLQDQIIKGSSVDLTLGAAEMDTNNWKSIIGAGFGDIHTEGSDELVGYGTSKLYQSSFSYAGQLVGHPKRKASSDRSADVTMWKTVANMTGINYTGDSVQIGQLEFKALPDRSKPEAINLFARGDHSLL